MANTMAATGKDAMHCAIGTDPAEFRCHKAMDDGMPTRQCGGYLAAKRYAADHFDHVKADLHQLAQELACRPEGDAIRAEFDEWAKGVDPMRRMNDYQLAALWDRRDR